MSDNNLSLEEKAILYESLLREHDKIAARVRELEVNFNPKVEDQKKIKQLKSEMANIEKRATLLGGFYG